MRGQVMHLYRQTGFDPLLLEDAVGFLESRLFVFGQEVREITRAEPALRIN